MRRLLVLLAAALAIAPAATAAKPFQASLRIAIFAQGVPGPELDFTLRCAGAKASGSLPKAADACASLATAKGALGLPLFAPMPAGLACATVYAGPSVAKVRGTFRGKAVAATYTRTDACQVARWEALSFLFGAIFHEPTPDPGGAAGG